MAKAYRYGHESQPEYYDDPPTPHHTDDGILSLLFLCTLGALIWKLFFSGSGAFDSGDWKAFRKAEQVRKDLKEVQDVISPPKADPPYSATIALNVPKPPPDSSKS
ncbi:MAG: hypothetical protein RL701_2792 [Pseudomonadota bacterium]